VRKQKTENIDLNSEYPCPCRRKGTLVQITLTEAFGCSRCQQIFVLGEKSQVIEQLSSVYHYKRAWRWTGSRWVTANGSGWESYLPVILGIGLVLLIIWLPLALRSPSASMIAWGTIAVVLAVLPAIMVWLAYRR